MHIETRGSGAPLVLIHGFGVDHRILLPLDDAIAARGGWRRIYVDLPGMGRSPIGDIASAEDLVIELADTVRGAIGDEPFALLGNSYGGMLARRLAHDFGEQVMGFATLAGVFVAKHGERTAPPRTVLHEDAAIFEGVPGAVADGYRGFAVWQSAAGLENFIETVQPGIELVDQAGLERIAENYAFEVEPEDQASVPFSKPALFIAGRQDDVVGYTDAWRRLDHYPRGSFLVLDAAGHNIIGEQLGLVAAAVGEWLDRVAAFRADAPNGPRDRPASA
ncbi:alpha/beta fold hydrolase [Gryllotalpicola protaetiae]|uniref:Alpha/beta hydrolase n=1 Tax=Gryllotalpicola protaetiae TaxID=2419771 RepID=A0A387BHH9_9MICO|nr:alpha/beta hydrolase [Gryllotalpicola protaetiae]AYG03283.1 alpha/beta hydrolase [Gryllotalpicola protaetiae]